MKKKAKLKNEVDEYGEEGRRKWKLDTMASIFGY